ncbi:MAG: N-6 DNA methylase, partial [Actinobacteria bacterium]|nr:N-6 DNA methylase [Actinomycetota bacterium]
MCKERFVEVDPGICTEPSWVHGFDEADQQFQRVPEILAPRTAYLRERARELLSSSGPLATLASDWQRYLMPGAEGWDFSDIYAQTITFAILLARFSGAGDLRDREEVQSRLGETHELLAATVETALNPRVKKDLGDALELLIRFVEAVDPTRFSADPWVYFYETFLAHYDPALRTARGVYYTPVEVVRAQVRLAAHVLETAFGCPLAFADGRVTTLDVACGTGTYLLGVLEVVTAHVQARYGSGAVPATLGDVATRLFGFEILMGPYTLAHLNLARFYQSAGVAGAPVQVYLTDTLEDPGITHKGQLTLDYEVLGEEHIRAQRVKRDTPILVCLGNPPYDRENLPLSSRSRRKGGWVRYGTENKEGSGPLKDFLTPLRETGGGVHAKNLYNDYVYFWRWALWKVAETNPAQGGLITFITASSYLAGPAFAGMRQVLREELDELWVIDLGGEGRGANAEENVFAIRTPVAIALGVRRPGQTEARKQSSAKVRYMRVTGSASEKLAALGTVDFGSGWQDCPDDWQAPFLSASGATWSSFPRLADLFPWQVSGVQ